MDYRRAALIEVFGNLPDTELRKQKHNFYTKTERLKRVLTALRPMPLRSLGILAIARSRAITGPHTRKKLSLVPSDPSKCYPKLTPNHCEVPNYYL